MAPELQLFGQAVTLGFVVAAPLGPTGATVIRHGLARGGLVAFWIGMGAALTDLIYILATYAGLLPLLLRLHWLPPLLYGLGALMLGRMGLAAVAATRRQPPPLPVSGALAAGGTAAGNPAVRQPGAWWPALLLGLSVTAVNPATIVAWFSVGGAFIAAHLQSLPLPRAAGVLLGVMLGSAGWFALLALLVGVARSSLGRFPWLLRGVSLLSGLALLAFSLLFAARALAAAGLIAG